MKKIVLVAGLMVMCGVLCAADKPNVIFFLTDDMGYSDVSCYGAKKVKSERDSRGTPKVHTPNIDRLAAEGFQFTDFHTGASICSPSRAAFLTGAYPQRCGLYMGINENRDAHWFLGLNTAEITLAELFKKQGYETFMIGKWHLGAEPELQPRKQGFDNYYGAPSNMGHNPEFLDGDKLVFAKTPLDQLTTLYTERAVKIIKEQGNSPFFLFFSHNYPHTPYKAGKEFVGSSKGGVRGDIIQEMDWGVGEMMKALEEAGIADNTIVVFTSDNGPTSNEYAKPYRGTKYVSFEGGHRVPFIFHWPKMNKDGAKSETPVIAMDLFPTLAEVIDEPLPDDRVYDGVSLMPLLKGKELARSRKWPFFYYNCENLQAVRYGDWKLHLTRTKEQIPWWDKNKAFVNLTKPVLYNMRTDPSESKDVAAGNPEIVQQILKIAENTRLELGEYMERGTAQRATGSVIADAPVISNEKLEWGNVDESIRDAISKEHQKRHPNSRKHTKTKKKKK